MIKFIKSLLGKKDPISTQPNNPPPYLWTGMYGTDIYPPADRNTLLNSFLSWVYIFVDKNARAVADVGLNVYAAKDTNEKSIYSGKNIDNRSLKHLRNGLSIKGKIDKALAIEEIYDHPINSLLDKPNKFYSGIELRYLTMTHLELTGDAYWYVIKNKMGVPVELWILNPACVKVVPDLKNYVSGYKYSTGTRDIFFDADEIIHFKYPNPKSFEEYYGLSPLEANWSSFGINTDIEVFQKAIFTNMGRPDGILMFDHNLDDPTYNRVRKDWDKIYKGASKAGKIGILEAGAKYQQLSNKPIELGYIESKKSIKEQLANAFGQTLAMYSESANRSNADTAIYSYVINTVVPKLNYIVDKINNSLTGLYDNKLFIGYEDIVPEDKEYLLKKKETHLRNGILTINEVREEEGLDPQIYGNYPMVNMASIPFAYDTTSKNMLMDRIPVMDRYGNSTGTSEKPKEAPVKEKPAKEEKKSYLTKSEDELEEMWENFRDMTETSEESLKTKLLKITDVYIKDLTARTKKEKDYINWLPNPEDYKNVINVALMKDYTKIYNKLYKNTVKDIKKEVTKKDEEEMTEERLAALLYVADEKIIEELKNRIEDDTIAILDSLRKQVLLKIIDGTTSRKTTQEIVDSILDYLPDYTEREIALMTRTGIIWAANQGKLVAMQMSKVVMKKQWYAALDERMCVHCGALHGETIELDKSFDLKKVEDLGMNTEFHNGDLQAPPLHPRCFDYKTEVLTDKGWMLFKDLNGELIYSLNPETREMEFVKYNKKIAYKYKGKMIHFSSYLVDLLVTPNHNMIYFEDKQIKQIDAEKMTTDKKILISKEKVVLGDILNKRNEDYDGFVYDVELEKNHILYVKRNNLFAWSGNCRCTIVPAEVGVKNE